MSKIKALKGMVDAQGLMAMAAEKVDPQDEVCVIIMKKNSMPLLYRTLMDMPTLAHAYVFLQHDVLSTARAVTIEEG